MAITTSVAGVSGSAADECGSTLSIPPTPAEELDAARSSEEAGDSDSGEFHDAAGEDTRFSLIPLQTPTTPRAPQFNDSDSGSSDASTRQKHASSSSSVIGQKSPRGSGSFQTHRTTLPDETRDRNQHPSSTSSMSYFLTRQKERLDSDPSAHRASIHGNAILKQGFDKLQQKTQYSEPEVDWGAFWILFKLARRPDDDARL
jgi:hypothetical protein